MDLRPYQQESINSLNNFLRVKPENPCVVIPTGGGKTIIFAELIKQYLTAWPTTRIIVLAHVKELVRQNAEKLMAYWPESWDKVGIYAASLNQRDTFASITFASIQSVYNKAMHLGHFDLIFIDEAHRIPVTGEGTYRTFVADCKRINPMLRVIGFTATPYRLGHGMVCGKDNILNEVCYEANVGDLIKEGYLSALLTKSSNIKIDLSDVHIRKGEYVAAELDEIINTDKIVEGAVDEMVDLCADRNAWIIFCTSVAHAEHVSQALMARHNIDAPVVHSQIRKSERDRIISDYCERKYRVICNINILAEGFDAPFIDAVIMLRPTKAAGLYYQQIGRGLRTHISKKDCLVLDFAGNIAEHGPIDKIRIKDKKPGNGFTPVKACPECERDVYVSVTTCPHCGYLWPAVENNQPKHGISASNDAILSIHLESQYIPVNRVRYYKHQKEDGKPSIRVEYLCGLKVYKEWVCVEHTGYPRAKAVAWWQSRTQSITPPSNNVDEALEFIRNNHFIEPKGIKINESSKHAIITGYNLT